MDYVIILLTLRVQHNNMNGGCRTASIVKSVHVILLWNDLGVHVRMRLQFTSFYNELLTTAYYYFYSLHACPIECLEFFSRFYRSALNGLDPVEQ